MPIYLIRILGRGDTIFSSAVVVVVTVAVKVQVAVMTVAVEVAPIAMLMACPDKKDAPMVADVC